MCLRLGKRLNRCGHQPAHRQRQQGHAAGVQEELGQLTRQQVPSYVLAINRGGFHPKHGSGAMGGMAGYTLGWLDTRTMHVAWRRCLGALAACLPRLSEVMGRWGLAGLAVRSMGATVGAARRKGHWGTCESALLSLYSLLFPSLTHQPLLPRRPAVYVSSRVSAAALGQQLRSLPAALPGLTKLELRFILPSSAPCLGAPLAQLQPDLSALTGLQTLYLIQVGAAQRGTLVGLPCDGLGGCVWFC